MVSKTREKLIEVARQLFARKGMENTTMNDIAEASDKGRRTVYTYFKNKREIYNAVLERESDALLQNLRDVVRTALDPIDKLECYLKVRFDLLAQLTPRQDYLRALFLHDYKRSDKIKRLTLSKETELFAQVMREGVASGVFDEDQANSLQSIETLIFHGVDMAHARDRFGESGLNAIEIRNQIISFIINEVRARGSEYDVARPNKKDNLNETT